MLADVLAADIGGGGVGMLQGGKRHTASLNRCLGIQNVFIGTGIHLCISQTLQ